MVGIYCFTNLTTNKKYVGQSKNIWNRYGTHYSTAFSEAQRSDTKFHIALREDPENWKFEILELCEENELNEKEREWIERLDSIENGYNDFVLFGGVDVYDMDGNFLKTYPSVRIAMNDLGLADKPTSNPTKVINGQGRSAYGFVWRKKGAAFEIKQKKDLNGSKRGGIAKPVYQYNQEHELINRYNSANAAAKALGVSQSAICQCCLGKIKTIKGFILSYNYEEWI